MVEADVELTNTKYLLNKILVIAVKAGYKLTWWH